MKLSPLGGPSGTYNWWKIVFTRKPPKVVLGTRLSFGGCFIWRTPKKGEKEDRILRSEGDFDKKIERYDEIDEGEDFFDIVVARKFAYYVSFWFVGRPNSQKEFQEMIDLALRLDEEETEPEEKKEKAKKKS